MMVRTSEESSNSNISSVLPSDAFRGAMRLLAAGVVVVTTEIDGRPWGLTISACCSISADPPRILVSLGSHTSTWKMIERSGRFGISLLSAKQLEIAQLCSAPGVPKFIDDHVSSRVVAGSPVVDGVLAHLDCRLESHQEVGDHQLVVGRVEQTLSPNPDDPLIYFERTFRSISAIAAS